MSEQQHMNAVLDTFRQRIAQGKPLQIRGGGTKDWYGQAPQGEVLDTRAYSGIIDYEPTELVITARCGTPLAEIDAALAQNNQMLAFEPPRFGGAATVGGMVAAGLSGPARGSAGAVRDFVLGAVLMDAQGEQLHFGGQVMKNVAGYDVSRLLAGSLGILGLILQVSLKVLPKPFASSTRVFEINQEGALRLLNQWGGQPLPLAASAWSNNVLTIRLAGAQAAVDAAVKKLGGSELSNGDDFWRDLREQTHAYFADPDAPLWRLSLPSVAPPVDLPGAQLVEWGGAQRWLRPQGPLDAVTIRAAALAAGGSASLHRGGDKAIGVFHPLQPAVEKIHRNLKTQFDPAGIFNPGRMYAGL
ncbi:MULTISPECIES: glycolate oxidase subunit GlcE [unclassified Herbaspirillum]|uniref:glycolate oxidase subunit GlcE n=1 Tax=unclassified Herbaspirillum TaxID=2624150 RepID=UPI00115499D2|nr:MULTISPECIES: glycolate oxidase subunit GlcE [unclassified Herbaspirillum]MBB5391600.1 glycolate oxidase FAD binding subunit [Herbaspirillum sp. SJZ102]TQK12718.1 glycolate oxidase FAD binding subunit [Herbaspirillum sp. SJZ130]TQK14722.1 glycolate oxidase FAD binding subunit [Herbaspirillum sp. SJZ106]